MIGVSFFPGCLEVKDPCYGKFVYLQAADPGIVSEVGGRKQDKLYIDTLERE